MARPLRIEAAGMWYHILSRGVLRKEIFKSDEDYLKFLETLSDNCEKFNVEIHSYVLMPNHFHFFLKTNVANLSRFMHRLLTAYTSWFIQKYEHVGHLFQGRYKSIVVDNNAYGKEITRYIHLNPVRTKRNVKLSLREKRKILKKYKWSSYSAMIGLKPAYPFLIIHDTLEYFGDNWNTQIKNYIDYIEEGLKKEIDNPLEDSVAQIVLGPKTFVREIRSKLKIEGKEGVKNINQNIRKIISLPIEMIIEAVAEEYKIDKGLILRIGKGSRKTEPRQVVFYFAHKYCVGIMTLRQISNAMGCKSSSSVSVAAKRINTFIQKDKQFNEKLKRIEKRMWGQAPTQLTQI